jgi:glycosyltransferase involved in cell wall biosynthesis
VCLTIAGDANDSASFSGAPASLLRGFHQTGLPVEPISTELSPSAQRLLINVLTFGFLDSRRLVSAVRSTGSFRLAFRVAKPRLLPSRELTWIRSFVVTRRLAQRPVPERMVKFGSEYWLPAGSDYVTLDDATIIQLWREYPYPWMLEAGARSLRRMVARQRKMFQRARACCVLNRWAAKSVVEDYDVDPSRVHVVGTGPNRDMPHTRRDWAIPHFLFVGKDFDRKNGGMVLAAFSDVRAHHPDATLDLVGNHPPVSQPGVTGHGFLRLDTAGDVLRLNSLFAKATCLVMPSLLEPTGNVHAEALAAGLGSIGTTSGGVDMVIGDSGVTVAPDDRDALTDSMAVFCDPAVAQEFGRRAANRAPLFTWAAVAERVIRALDLPAWRDTPLASYL